MKIFEIIKDEFQNVEIQDYHLKVVHAYRVQKAKCHELEIFLQRLNQTIKQQDQVSQPWIDRFTNSEESSTHTRSLDILVNWFERFCSSYEADNIKKLYNRMIKAKKEFEAEAAYIDVNSNYAKIMRRARDHKNETP